MENTPPDQPTPWYIGQHETNRGLPVSDSLLRQAQDLGYDMLTSPITTPHFRISVLDLVDAYFTTAAKTADPSALPIPLVPALKPTDSTLIPGDMISQLIITTSTWIDLASPNPIVANVSRQVFNLEVAYAAFCGVQHVVVQGPDLTNKASIVSQFSRAMKEAISIGPYIQFHVLMPMEIPKQPKFEPGRSLSKYAEFVEEVDQPTVPEWSTWEAWNAIRQFCNYSGRLTLALSFPKRLPPAYVLSRWSSEPLRLIFIPRDSFTLNKYQQPAFTAAQKAVLYRLMRLRSSPWILLGDVALAPSVLNTLDPKSASSAGADPWPLPAESMGSSSEHKHTAASLSDPTPHLTYMRQHMQRHQPPKPPVEKFGAGYQDYLQAPLQPLADNLESITYEVFEKDPIKYDWYEQAMTTALFEWQVEEKPTSSSTGAVVLAVVGSGRGPLVTRALRASEASGVEVEVWAIEKNPNAYVLLQQHNEFDWGRKVNIVKTDMRAWKGPQKEDGSFGHVDILVSELLGSFADNELSPECLDGVQHVLNPDCGISIPASYTAHLTPISTPKLHADLLHKSVADRDVFDLPYVVMLHQLDYLSTTNSKPTIAEHNSLHSSASVSPPEPEIMPNVKTCWEFKHPIPSTIIAQSNLRRGGSAAGGYGGSDGGDGANEHNSRFCHLTFPCAHRGTCHGLAGYFETVLYTSTDVEDSSSDFETPSEPPAYVKVELSTNPVTMDKKSKDMISWFPIYFPLRTPVSFSDNAEVDVSMWRLTDDRKVWYEWCVEAFVKIPGTGERVRIGGGEVQSSRKNGCLM